MDDKLKAYVSELKFNDGSTLPIAQNDIVLFVGPNNVGKSQALNDIYTKCGENKQTIVVQEIKTIKSDGSLLELIMSVTDIKDNGNYINYNLNGNVSTYSKDSGENLFRISHNYSNHRDLFVCRISTQQRLTVCQPVSILDHSQPMTNPLHYALYDVECAKWLSTSFRDAFGSDLTANSLRRSTIPLFIGPTVVLAENYNSEIERQAAYEKTLESYNQVHLQGDGIKSFTGILLYLMLKYFCTYIIDEPEAFLHPPQARIMGQTIGNTLRDDQQAFISTHSVDIVEGLLDTCKDRLKIVRITRSEDINYFSILNNDRIQEVFGDPLLRYSNIMDSLFYKHVVLCESDSDCKFYSIVESNIKGEENKYSETLFIHCGGKHRMSRIVKALRSLNIDIQIIVDIDVLNEESVFSSIVSAFDIDWDKIKEDYKLIISFVNNLVLYLNREETRKNILSILDNSDSVDIKDDEVKDIRELLKKSKWKIFKEKGKEAFESTGPIDAYNRLEEILSRNGIHIVPVGELEGFVKEVNGHGPNWVNNVLEQYPNFTDSVYDNVKQFIQALDI